MEFKTENITLSGSECWVYNHDNQNTWGESLGINALNSIEIDLKVRKILENGDQELVVKSYFYNEYNVYDWQNTLWIRKINHS